VVNRWWFKMSRTSPRRKDSAAAATLGRSAAAIAPKISSPICTAATPLAALGACLVTSGEDGAAAAFEHARSLFFDIECVLLVSPSTALSGVPSRCFFCCVCSSSSTVHSFLTPVPLWRLPSLSATKAVTKALPRAPMNRPGGRMMSKTRRLLSRSLGDAYSGGRVAAAGPRTRQDAIPNGFPKAPLK